MSLKTMRNMKIEYTSQMSNVSINYISENQILEAIYDRVFEENEQKRADKRQPGKYNPFLTGIGK